ncbi:type II secretion system protein GspL [Halopseudomonas pelagia]|uniref:type II secretion system protein GspL n=1 Tax=Halopseudomonas pelagia TaxID=553151 RepID=UPI0003A7BAA1|nr:type II secretion system protein GspL [Halopseudomonas pelagia]
MLIVLLPENSQQPGLSATLLYWWQLDREGLLVEEGQDTLTDLRLRFAAERLRALAPAMAVGLYRLDMPVKRAASIRAALPYALEDLLSQDLELLHCVAGPRREDGRIAAAVVEQEHMQERQEVFRECGWRVDAILPLAALHAQDAPEAGLRIMPSPWPSTAPQALITAADQEPALIEEGMLLLWLQRRLAALPEPQRRLELVGYQPAALGLGSAEGVSILPMEAGADLMQALRRALGPTPSLNLLSGAYAVSMAAPPWRKARPAMIAAGVVVFLALGQVALEWAALTRERDRLVEGINSVFERSLPNSRRVDAPEQFRQVMQGSAAAAGGQGSGALLYEALAVIKESDGARIRQFRSTPNELEVELQMKSFADLEALRTQLSTKPGLTETLQGADSGTEGVTARLKVSRRES